MTDLSAPGQIRSMSLEPSHLRVVGADRQTTFRRIYAEHQEFVWRTVQHLGLARELADDATQEVFIVVHRRLQDYDSARPFRSWLWGIARLVVKGIRRGQARGARKLAVVRPPNELPSPDELLDKERAVRFVDGFLDKLGSKHGDVFVLCELEGLSGPEAADALGVRLNTVYSRLRKARKLFAEALRRRALSEGEGKAGETR